MNESDMPPPSEQEIMDEETEGARDDQREHDKEFYFPDHPVYPRGDAHFDEEFYPASAEWPGKERARESLLRVVLSSVAAIATVAVFTAWIILYVQEIKHDVTCCTQDSQTIGR